MTVVPIIMYGQRLVVICNIVYKQLFEHDYCGIKCTKFHFHKWLY